MSIKLSKKNKDSLSQLGVEVVYLFGSQARGAAGPLSDFDFACLFSPLVKKSQDLKLELVSLFTAIVGSDDVDVVILNLPETPLTLKYRVIKEGKILYNTSDKSRSDFEYKTMRQYLDRKYYLDRHVEMALESFSKVGLK